jgi:hypothetical protein
MNFPPNFRDSYKVRENMQAGKFVCMNYLVQVNLFGVCDSWLEDRRDISVRQVTREEDELLRFREPLPVCDLEGNTWPI